MKRLLLLLICVAWSGAPPRSGLLLGANKAAGTLFFVNAETLAVVDTAATGRFFIAPHSKPHDLAVSSDGKTFILFAAWYYVGSAPAGGCS